jgi:hypothetical protein
MANQDQLEIIGPGGEIEFHALDPDKGVTNIGRHPQNDIVVDSPDIALFHAVLDHRHKPYQLMVLSDEADTVVDGQRLAPNSFRELRNWDTVEIDGYTMILLEGSQAASRVQPGRGFVPASPPVPPSALPEDMAALVGGPGGGAAGVAPPLPAVGLQSAAAAPMSGVDAKGSEGGASQPARPVRLAAPLPDRLDDVIMLEISARQWTVDVDQTATAELTIVNGGDIVAAFVVAVEGLDPSWVTITPRQVNLYEGARTTVALSFTPPRAPTSSAGSHPLGVVVTSPNHPGRVSRLGATLIVNPYYEFAVGDLSPKQQTISWFRRFGEATIPVTNTGNSETPFRLDGEDDERGCRFEFQVPGQEAALAKQAEIRLQAGEEFPAHVSITPVRRRLVALRSHRYGFTITSAMVEGAQTPRSVMGHLKAKPLIGPGLLLLILLCVAAVVVFLLRPAPAPALAIDNSNPNPHDAVTLTYDASRFAGLSAGNLFNRLNGLFCELRLEFKPTDGDWQAVKSPADFEKAVGKFADTPIQNGKYRLRVNTWLSQLVPMLEGVSKEALVFVTPVEPKIVDFRADPERPLVGEKVTIYWKVSDAEVLKLAYEGIEETFQGPELESGKREFTLDKDTTFTLVATNTSWEGEVQKPLQVIVIVPTKTPMPTPVIVQFDVDPLVITEGDTVRITWEVQGADVVTIDPLGKDFVLQGDVGDQPKSLTNYQLTAIRKGDDGSEVKNIASKEVMVNPLPTPTLEPVAPEIQIFEVLPKEVVRGNTDTVKLTWSVGGVTTNIEITAPDLKISGLKAQDTISVTVKDTTLFVLTAYNGPQSSSAPVEVTVLEPTPLPTETPAPTPEPPPTATPTPFPPPVISFYMAEAVSPPDDKVAFKTSYESGNGIFYVYEVQAGSMVKLSWKVTNADAVTLQDFGPQPPEAALVLPDPVVASVTYMLAAVNNKGANETDAYVKLELLARPAPPTAYDLGGEIQVDKDGNPLIILSWYYDKAFATEIDGFRIYRADVSPGGDGLFEPVDELQREDTWARKTKYQWTDQLKAGDPTCGRAYYVTAFYMDVVANEEKETNSSTTSYYTAPCSQ